MSYCTRKRVLLPSSQGVARSSLSVEEPWGFGPHLAWPAWIHSPGWRQLGVSGLYFTWFTGDGHSKMSCNESLLPACPGIGSGKTFWLHWNWGQWTSSELTQNADSTWPVTASAQMSLHCVNSEMTSTIWQVSFFSHYECVWTGAVLHWGQMLFFYVFLLIFFTHPSRKKILKYIL